MIILLFGNIGSGKTSIARKLVEQRAFQYFSIDDFRVKYGDGSVEKEQKLKQRFTSEVVESVTDNLVVEILGTGKLNELLYNGLKNFSLPILLVILKVPTSICLARIRNRVWKIPFPVNFGPPKQIIFNTERRLFLNRSYKIWEKIETCKILVRDNISPEDQQEILHEINSFINAIRS